eukprot:TRINITY_DN10762_c0_g2_i5.p1 TRINITY_DN10762_c0_g2~~TRINITY_DN10762_c0_g2_i5.p1  ORF type:complete len:350 (+),score=63.95 TRINITY_DN10762_c0_g2_i5:51-1052(+)
MPKKASAKSTKGKKGKGKASKKLSRRKDTPQKPEQPSLKWPWQAATTAWLDHRLENRAKILREFRGHYLFGDGIVTSHDEWLQSVKLHTQPFASKQVESLVQLLVTLMLFEGDERHPAHNGHIFAAALRFRHGRRHFERMQEQLAAWFEIINRSSNFQQLLNYIISQHQAHDDSHVAKETVVKWLADNPIVISNRPDIPNELDKDVLFPVLKRFAAYLMHTQLSACKLFQTWDTTGCGSVTVEHTLNVLQAPPLTLSAEGSQLLMSLVDADENGQIVYQDMALFRLKAALAEVAAEWDKPLPESDDMPPEIKLTLDIEELTDVVLYCHYATRP